MSVKLRGKQAFHTIEQTLPEFARIAATPEGIHEGIEHLTLRDTRLKNDKVSQYRMDEPKAISILFPSLSDNDHLLLAEHTTAKNLWTYLKDKYQQVDATSADVCGSKIRNFAFPEGKTITSA